MWIWEKIFFRQSLVKLYRLVVSFIGVSPFLSSALLPIQKGFFLCGSQPGDLVLFPFILFCPFLLNFFKDEEAKSYKEKMSVKFLYGWWNCPRIMKEGKRKKKKVSQVLKHSPTFSCLITPWLRGRNYKYVLFNSCPTSWLGWLSQKEGQLFWSRWELLILSVSFHSAEAGWCTMASFTCPVARSHWVCLPAPCVYFPSAIPSLLTRWACSDKE